MNKKCAPDWIAVDWGTTHLRAYAMQGATVVSRAKSDDGMGRLKPADFEPALRALIGDWLAGGNVPVIACGMVGSRQGWVEAPYRAVPCAPLTDTLTTAPTTQGLEVRVICGLSQNNPADVMRGEETQVAGFLHLNPGWDGVLCLPGTHTKWVHLSAGEVVSFQTFMSGELFALISQNSVLRHSVIGEGWDAGAFEAAVSDAMSHPERLAARLFSLRAADLLHGTAASVSRAALSGLLIGGELAAARPYWLGQNTAILGTGTQARAYQSALRAQGVEAMRVDSERATLAGLTTAYKTTKATL
ncbi:putative 2-dehydro-3-deoxygalactonokinase DgoK1 [Roseobacter fucihabitans]|uniref:2-dehydro-3-deoxygalactonokinase DgoK1 n=1 Tax=Roseobacter fucihabitans TaxID=1537242 RepID=A0ABZ2BRI9_9RHOB|nr:2-dehydro-3-deoxygalactonokinase [Roseobacter litoralis]MBC6964385.1 2-keto-3-deoxy-galactonokinase [Roseobacter litoralis]